MVGRYSVYWICFFLEIKTSAKLTSLFTFELRAGEKGHLKILKRLAETLISIKLYL